MGIADLFVFLVRIGLIASFTFGLICVWLVAGALWMVGR